MSSGGVRSIRIEGFASIRDAEVRLGDLNVLVGANGSGKSNFVRALELLGRIVDGDLQLFFGVNGFAALSHRPADGRMEFTVDSPPYGYKAVLEAARDDAGYFSYEGVLEAGGWRDLGRRGHRESVLSDDWREGPDSVREVLSVLAGCRVFHFHDTSVNAPVKRRVSTADNIALRSDAGNLASYLWRLANSDSPVYRQIVGAVRQVAPFFHDFVLRVDPPDTILLRWRQVDHEAVFSANQLSDGTLRFICLATLLLSPGLPQLVVLDEPELGLHPYAIVQLAGMLRSASVRSQVVVATQSVTLMNLFELSDLIVVERRGGASAFSRPDAEQLREWLAEYSLGELWEKNMLGGRPGPEHPA
jgi:predicted ATPase